MLLSSPPSSLRHLMQGRRLAPVAAAIVVAASLAAGAPRAAHAQTPQAAPKATAAAQTDVQRLVNEGKLPQALKALDDSLIKTPKDSQLRFQRGVVLSMMNRRAEALSTFQKLVEEHPDMSAAHNNMAVIYGAESNYEAAKLSLEKAVKSNPNYATAYQNLGDVHVQLATQAYQKAQQLDKADTSVQPKLALLRDVLGGNASAPATAGAPSTTSATTAAATRPGGPPVVASVVTMGSTAGAKPAGSAATAATPAPASAKPAEATKPGEPAKSADAATADITQMVRNWTTAWSSRDVAAYVAFYTPDFAGKSGSHKAWEKDRAERVGGRTNIKVEVSDVVISVIGDKADVRFKQSYESESVKSTDRKRLSLVRVNGQWLIRREVVET